ncbi:uncharacterized protein FRV6_09539 [Fusarium oxysporum]|uniref:Bacteriophage T5 Orf172 DNA-binding domain-containing protein n=1 Tax=Fusarium oxysporum TaxID=5507 RepID=A0A2H3T9U0_FUSOX|nr:uncharacterized protein FRV6_09539 [Fusarium oxysporum]
MSRANSLSEASSSLYKALEIPQGGEIDCFARGDAQSQNLHKIPKTRRKDINYIVKALAVQEPNDEDQNATIKDLAEKLVCYGQKKRHTETLVFDGDSFSNPVDYVHALLTRRFYNWLKTKNKERLYTEHPRLVRYSQKSSTSLRGRGVTPTSKRTSDQSQGFLIYDTDDGEYSGDYLSDNVIESIEEDIDLSDEEFGSEEDSEDEGIGECSRQTSTQPELRRPRLTRESPLSDREIPRTPSRNQSSRYRNIYSKSPSPLSYPTPTDDAFLTSPGSVTSPDPSEIFTPYSTASTPYSIFSTEGCETPRSSRTSFYKEAYAESPTRRKTQRVDDDSSGDPKREMKPNADDLVNKSEEAESDVESSRSRRSMTFDDTGKSPVHNIMSRLVKPVEAKNLSGYIYCFAERSKPGFLKIGHVVCPESSKSDQKSDQVEKRMEEWRHACKHDLDFRFEVFMPCSVPRMESLIHQTLHREKQYASCPNTACPKTHREWFKIEENQARQVIKVWEQFSKLKPYDKEGRLTDNWARYELTQLAQLDNECLWNTKKWLATEWFRLITEAVEKDLAPKQEKRRAVEQQLAQMKMDEKPLQQMLVVLRKAQQQILA